MTVEAISHISNVDAYEKDRLTLWNSCLCFVLSEIVESLVTESRRDLYLF